MERTAKQRDIVRAGIITWHYYSNFGSSLQAYALQRTLEKLGYRAELINYRNPQFGVEKTGSRWIRIVLAETMGRLHNPIGARMAYPLIRFQFEHLKQTRVVYAHDDIKNVINGMDAIVCGSDQIWAPNAFDPAYMADFADGTKVKKISYAASIGLRELSKEKARLYETLLRDFTDISVREAAGKDILKDLGVKAEVTLDPTLLLEKSEYDRIMQIPRIRPKSQYVFCYFLNEKNGYKDKVLEFANRRHLQIIGKSANPDDANWIKQLPAIGPSEFLWLIANSKFVVTDSYHGTIFSLLYHKQFHTFRRFSPGDPVDQNSRIEQLCRYFNLDSRIVTSESPSLSDEEYDFKIFESNVADLRQQSLRFLHRALRE